MGRTGIRFVAAAVVFAVVATGCGKDRDESAPTTSPPTSAATTEPATVDTTGTSTPASGDATTPPPTESVPTVPMFGDAPWPCGPADTPNTDSGSEPGVTADTITIADGDDAGTPISPGLNHEMTDTMNAFVAKCNELGGIHGRQIVANYYDAKLFEVGTAMQSACDGGNFFLVGEGWAFDSNQEEIRLGCGLPAVPSYATSAAFAHGKDVFVAIPNPSDETPGGYYEQIATLFPDKVTSAATLAASFPATQDARDRAVAAATQFGWNFLSTTIEYNPAGEADWTPFVKQLQDTGAKILYWSGTCLPHLQLFAQAAKANGLDVPIVTDANHYAAVCAAANTDGALDNLYIRVNAVPFEEADVNPATQELLDLVTGNGGEIATLGANTASSFLLWATAASQCGAELTRACTLQNLANIHSWTGHGLHSETDPGGNHPSPCSMVLRLKGTAYERVVPSEPGTFECKDNWVVPINTPATQAAKLDANRISQQFATS
jgi:ABC-type branched-subunit amino acid transport system substrate-binding protein